MAKNGSVPGVHGGFCHVLLELPVIKTFWIQNRSGFIPSGHSTRHYGRCTRYISHNFFGCPATISLVSRLCSIRLGPDDNRYPVSHYLPAFRQIRLNLPFLSGWPVSCQIHHNHQRKDGTGNAMQLYDRYHPVLQLNLEMYVCINFPWELPDLKCGSLKNTITFLLRTIRFWISRRRLIWLFTSASSFLNCIIGIRTGYLHTFLVNNRWF